MLIAICLRDSIRLMSVCLSDCLEHETFCLALVLTFFTLHEYVWDLKRRRISKKHIGCLFKAFTRRTHLAKDVYLAKHLLSALCTARSSSLLILCVEKVNLKHVQRFFLFLLVPPSPCRHICCPSAWHNVCLTDLTTSSASSYSRTCQSLLTQKHIEVILWPTCWHDLEMST